MIIHTRMKFLYIKMNIIFQKATSEHKDMIFSWLEEPHVKEFWDSSQAHKDDIINFIGGRKTPSNYAKGKYEYWIGSQDDVPYAMLMIIPNTLDDDIDNIYIENLSKFGNTYAIDFMIGNPDFIGKGLGAKTLSEFMEFYRENIDKKADTFQIDPEAQNERAKHVYEKAGFEHIDDFVMTGNHSGSGKLHHFLVKRFN